MFEKVLSIDNSAFLGDEERKDNYGVGIARASWGPCRYEQLIGT